MQSPDLPQVSTVTYHVFNGTPVGQRLDDGYWEATAMCRAFGKEIGGYLRSKDKQEFLAALEADMQICISELIQVVKGGDPSKQGSWAHPLVMIDLAQWCDKKAQVKVTKAIYHWMATGQVPQGDIGVNYIVANMVHPVQKLRNKGMRGTIWNEHEDKAVAVQHMIDFQTAEFHKYHPGYRWPKDFVLDMYRKGKITAKGITYRETLRRLGQDAEAATLATMDQGRDQYKLSDEKAIEFGHGFLSGFEHAQRLGGHHSRIPGGGNVCHNGREPVKAVTHTFTSGMEGPVGGGDSFMVTPDRLPITRVLSVTTEPGGPVDRDGVQMDDTDSVVMIPRNITTELSSQDHHPRIITTESSSQDHLPTHVRKAPRLAGMVEYETSEPEPAQLAMPSARTPR